LHFGRVASPAYTACAVPSDLTDLGPSVSNQTLYYRCLFDRHDQGHEVRLSRFGFWAASLGAFDEVTHGQDHVLRIIRQVSCVLFSHQLVHITQGSSIPTQVPTTHPLDGTSWHTGETSANHHMAPSAKTSWSKQCGREPPQRIRALRAVRTQKCHVTQRIRKAEWRRTQANHFGNTHHLPSTTSLQCSSVISLAPEYPELCSRLHRCMRIGFVSISDGWLRSGEPTACCRKNCHQRTEIPRQCYSNKHVGRARRTLGAQAKFVATRPGNQVPSCARVLVKKAGVSTHSLV
jgi:hypothetical protein